MNRQDFIAGLRQLAQIYEDNPFLDVPYQSPMYIWTYSAEDFVRNVAGFRNGAKKYTDADVEFIPDTILDLKVCCSRSQVCERKVVGSKHVPEKIIPAQTIPAHDEDIVEWDCKPLLARANVPQPEFALELESGKD